MAEHTSLLPHLGKLVLILGAVAAFYDVLPEEKQKAIDGWIGGALKTRTAVVTVCAYAAVTLTLYGFFMYGAAIIPYLSVFVAWLILAAISLVLVFSASAEKGLAFAIWPLQVLILAVIAFLAWLGHTLIPTSAIAWCFWPYTQLATLAHHAHSDLIHTFVPMVTGADIADRFEQSNAAISSYLASWNEWPWWLFSKPPFNWLFLVYVRNYMPVLILSEIVLQVSILVSLFYLLRLISFSVFFVLFRAADALKAWLASGKTRMPILGLLLILSGSIIDYITFLLGE